MSAYPDIAGIAGFASVSGPGIGQAVKEADKVGKIKITCVDGQPEHLDLVKSDVISKPYRTEKRTVWMARRTISI